MRKPFALAALLLLGACATQAPVQPVAAVQAEADAQVIARAFPVEQMVAEQIASSRSQLYASLSRDFPGREASIQIYVEEFLATNMRDVMDDLVGVVADEFRRNFTPAELQVFRRVLLSSAGQEAMRPGVAPDRMSKDAIAALMDLDRNVDHGRMAAFGAGLAQRHNELRLMARLRAEKASEQTQARLAELGLKKN